MSESDFDSAAEAGVLGALTGDSEVAALVAARVYVLVPENPAFPYLQVQIDIADDETGCAAGSELAATVHVWSRRRDIPEVKRIAARVRKALNKQISIEGHVVDTWAFEGARYMDDPDGVTLHGVVTLSWQTVPAA